MPVETTTVQGKVITPDGVAVTEGSIVATLAQPGSALDGATSQRVGGRVEVSISAAGISGLVLVPNDVMTPAGTYYRVSITVREPIETSWIELWSVASSPDPVDVGAVARLQVAPGLSIAPLTRDISFSWPYVLSAGLQLFPNGLDLGAGRPATITGFEASVEFGPSGGPMTFDLMNGSGDGSPLPVSIPSGSSYVGSFSISKVVSPGNRAFVRIGATNNAENVQYGRVSFVRL